VHCRLGRFQVADENRGGVDVVELRQDLRRPVERCPARCDEDHRLTHSADEVLIVRPLLDVGGEGDLLGPLEELGRAEFGTGRVGSGAEEGAFGDRDH